MADGHVPTVPKQLEKGEIVILQMCALMGNIRDPLQVALGQKFPQDNADRTLWKQEMLVVVPCLEISV